MFLSVIIPAHNEEKRLPPTLAAVDAFLEKQAFTSDIIVVENGSHDLTAVVAEAFAADHPRVRVIRETARGKGLAVRRGMLESQARYRFFADADLSMPIEEVLKFIPPALDVPVAIGSREVPGSRRYNEPAFRHIQGRVFSWMVKLLAFPGIEDTQCGFKCFRADVVADLFSVQTFTGMSFDVELLFVAQKRGYKIVEVPVNWYYRAESRVRPFFDQWDMLKDIFTIRRNWRAGRYAPRVPPQ